MVYKNARVVQDGYEDSERVVTCALGATDGLQVVVGLQGSTLRPFLFAVVIDRLT